jgi:hypothetical protein
LAHAPDFDAARFLARQANEEMAHAELRLRRMGVLRRPLASIGAGERRG